MNLKVSSTSWPGATYRASICGISTAMTVSDVSIKAIRGRKGQARDANAFAQREVGQVAVGRGPHHGLVQIPLCAVELGLALLDIESAAGAGFQELRRLSETLLRGVWRSTAANKKSRVRGIKRSMHDPNFILFLNAVLATWTAFDLRRALVTGRARLWLGGTVTRERQPGPY